MSRVLDLWSGMTGAVLPFAGATAPDGWLMCEGQAISRADYKNLFDVIGTTHGVGNGSTTFAVPELRGEFIRGLDRGRGIDPGRTLGSRQKGSLQTFDSDATNFDPTGLQSTNGNDPISNHFGLDNLNGDGYGGRSCYVSAPAGAAAGGSLGVSRPRNVAMNYIIKT